MSFVRALPTVRRCFTSLSFREPRILAISGSCREGSLNVQLLNAAVNLAKNRGAKVRVANLGDLKAPLYSAELEKAGIPDSVTELRDLFQDADGFLISCPEYNGMLTPLLLNSVTWVSRAAKPGEGAYDVFKGKSAAIMSASPGPLGGLRGLASVRDLLFSIGSHVLPQQVAVGHAGKAFTDEGELKDERQALMLEASVVQLVDIARMTANRESACEAIRLLRASETCGEYGRLP
eukprot:c7666_g1_i2.p1 GENE.c7666_g1_i2~~c7666_g1_i2.p1  ORF type:complete len:235 (+),score=25.05 c7666_g1_i2:46-750(+)